MIRKLDSILLNSGNAKKLAEFYKTKVGIKNTGVFEMGDKGEEAYIYEFAEGSNFSILDHSDIKGKSSDPKRIILNFEVSDIDEAIERMEKNGVKIIQGKYHVEGYGYIATYEDLDGNYFQLVQVRENN